MVDSLAGDDNLVEEQSLAEEDILVEGSPWGHFEDTGDGSVNEYGKRK